MPFSSLRIPPSIIFVALSFSDGVHKGIYQAINIDIIFFRKLAILKPEGSYQYPLWQRNQ